MLEIFVCVCGDGICKAFTRHNIQKVQKVCNKKPLSDPYLSLPPAPGSSVATSQCILLELFCAHIKKYIHVLFSPFLCTNVSILHNCNTILFTALFCPLLSLLIRFLEDYSISAFPHQYQELSHPLTYDKILTLFILSKIQITDTWRDHFFILLAKIK